MGCRSHLIRPTFSTKESFLGRKVEIELEYQPYIESPPVTPRQLYGQACSSDGATIDAFRDVWIANIKANKARFGSFKDHSIGQLFGKYQYQPVIVAGSGPSLKVNGHLLKDRGGIGLVSCLHNFSFFEDREVAPDFYVTLDAGEVTIEEVYEGGAQAPEWYWERTKGKKLVAFIGTHPKLLEKWQGEVYFYNAPVPDSKYQAALNEIEPFHTYISNGGNVLGACLYAAKGYFGGNPIAFVGADFCFSYDKKFHAWASKYDANLGHVVPCVDVYGNRVLTWRSYANFKCWFDFVSMQVPGLWVNCTEGGTFGAYPDGNLMSVKQQDLAAFLDMYHMNKHIKGQCESPEMPHNNILF